MIALLAALALSSATPASDGPWRQLIAFTPTEERPDGASLWITDAAVLPADGPRSREMREAKELWVVSGATVGGQAITIKSRRYACGDGEIHTDAVAVYDREGRLLGTGPQSSGPDYPISHSADAEAYDAVCLGSRIAARGAVVATVADAVALAGPERVVETQTSLRYDVNYDGQDDTIRIAMRPHSMRHDVELVLSPNLNREINVVAAEQPLTGAVVERRIRPLERDRYLIACDMDEGVDVAPCQPDYVLAQRGVEIVTPGQPTVIVWLDQGKPRVARLP